MFYSIYIPTHHSTDEHRKRFHYVQNGVIKHWIFEISNQINIFMQLVEIYFSIVKLLDWMFHRWAFQRKYRRKRHSLTCPSVPKSRSINYFENSPNDANKIIVLKQYYWKFTLAFYIISCNSVSIINLKI